MQQLESALNRFCARKVNLDPAVTRTARSDRDWLVDRLLELPAQDPDFPLLDSRFPRIYFGSFARRTKVRPLDDIDLMVVMDPKKLKLDTGFFGGKPKVLVPEGTRLEPFLHPSTRHLNSRLVVNQFIRSLRAVPKFQHADLHRNGAAAVMQLKKQAWTYDIVPAFHVRAGFFTPSRFIIPDGQGHWQYTDPRVDQERATETNQSHHGQVLEMVRLIKFWNKEHGPPINSYLLETLVLNWYINHSPDKNAFQCEAFFQLLKRLSWRIYRPVRDPKGIQGDLNLMSREHRQGLSQRAEQHASLLKQGIRQARKGDSEQAIKSFQAVLGSDFGK